MPARSATDLCRKIVSRYLRNIELFLTGGKFRGIEDGIAYNGDRKGTHMESITIVIKDQVGTRGFSVSRTRMVPPTKNIDEFTTAEFRALNNFVDTEKEGLAHLAEEKATAMTGQEAGAPVCPICGAATKISSSRKTWV